MNMSDDIAGAVIQYTVKTAEEAVTITKALLEAIYKLLHFLAERDREKRRQKTDVKNKEITEIKNGKVSVKDLTSYCRKTGDVLVTSEMPLTKDDMHYVAAQAKKFGIPVAFRNEKGKDNVYALLRKDDVPIFSQIITEHMKEKVATRPQDLSNFKCKAWEIPFINAELSRLDLSAQFAQMKNGEYIALYEAKDAKAIEIARSEFVRKVKEVDKNLEFSKDKDGFYIIRDKATGKDYPFDNTPDRKFVSLALQKHFGYDENKANIAAQKFGNEMLTGDVKQQYFSDNPLNDFSYVSQVTWDKEDVLVKAYECYYITPKADGISRVVYQKDDGSIAVLNPPRQTKAKMRSILEKELGVTDTKEQDALIAKAEHVSIVNAKYRNVYGNTEDIHIHNATFTKDAFDMTNTAVVSGMLRTDADGNTYTKTQPIDSVSTDISRKDADTFEVKSTAIATESDKNGQQYSVPQTEQRILSFSNKKTALEELKEMYISQGVPETAAKDMAKNVYHKAELQNVSPVIAIERTKDTTAVFTSGNKRVEISVVDRAAATEALSSEFGISTEDASAIIDKADELVITSESQVDTNSNDMSNVATSSNSETPHNDMTLAPEHLRRMSREEFIAAGFINNNEEKGSDLNDHNVNEKYLVSKYKINAPLDDLDIPESHYLFSKEGHYFTYTYNDYTKNYHYDEVTEKKANEIINEHGTVDSFSEKATANGHELHPEGNILSEQANKVSAAADKIADKMNDMTDKVEEVASRGGR